MSDVKNFEDYLLQNTPHIAAELLCVRCISRWPAVWPESCMLRDIECPHCKQRGGVIATGQIMSEDYDE